MRQLKYIIPLIFISLATYFIPQQQSQAPKYKNQADSSQQTYFEARPLFWKKIYPRGGETLYCGKKFSSYHGKKINVEHVFPMSWVTKKLRCGSRDQCRKTSPQFNKIEADMHNFYPSLAKYNSKRSAMAYAVLPGEPSRGQCDFEVSFYKRKVEPRPQARGKIARAMLYMEKQYQLEIFPRQKRLLLSWHKQHPADQKERRRNQRIARLQGHANSYIN